MSEFRRDPLFGTISLIARERSSRPHRARREQQTEAPGPCPLCPGNEGLCPPETARFPPDTVRWFTRAVPNRYPSVSLESPYEEGVTPERDEPLPGFGVHEVIVDSPHHSLPFWSLGPEESALSLRMVQRRILDLYHDRRISYLSVFKNHGQGSGASLSHPHFQLVGLPFVPAEIARLVAASGDGCQVCRLLEMESIKGLEGVPLRLMAETTRFIAYADYAPSFQGQFSIYPKRHEPAFEAAQPEALMDLAQLFTLVLGRMGRLWGDIAMNLVLYNRPNTESFSAETDSEASASFHWFFRVCPRMGQPGGFEIGTGITVIQISPEDAARAFREKAV